MLRSSLCGFNDEYILFKGTISMAQVLAPAEQDHVGRDKDVVMSMYNLIE